MGTDHLMDGSIRLRLDLAYRGAPFHGWARQPDLLTVQGRLEEALSLITRQPILLTVAGRTDAGVHARGQVAHLDVPKEFWLSLSRGREESDELRGERLRARLEGLAGRGLNGALAIKQVRVVPKDFDARFSALSRTYRYLICDDPRAQDPCRLDIARTSSPLEEEKMQVAAQALCGEHDFLPFAKPREGATTVRTLHSFNISRPHDGIVQAMIRADAFCHSQVRFMMGALIEIGRGKYEPNWIGELLAAGVRDQRVPLADGRGLTLWEVAYPPADQYALQAQKAKVVRTLPENSPS
ncbi:MAG: tRNA pseudouridine(38-40) synthase TruA [Varibaculum cambriense]|uniref:tRNA pseudouridine(38-40) synthase TruA n=1 Tax=Varibaculum cambriense TaxID=184870 RepID=UPI002900C8E5|nr:tRNA pseudouridine(38-40) synthase TruA [Varibaculum cambriense]MDU1683576.1 tRNA pseudouridine(38-40) synthase TruA [Varibaculum cambriense]MDU2150717.1 tRNA pseudouridine(38-40) synthase TruA [Varibaculum cambriense]MDU7413072.1 tRNA pseudouridine(38-40) synthase TruA [Varibaculum cambriense]